MECISLCGTSCLCTLSASAFIEPSLRQLDFFLEIFFYEDAIKLELSLAFLYTYLPTLIHHLHASLANNILTKKPCTEDECAEYRH